MPDNTQHINHAKHNIDFLKNFYSSFNFNDWTVTVCFYTAIHIIEAAINKTKNLQINGEKISIQHSGQLSRYKNLIPYENISDHASKNIIVKENFPKIAGFLKSLYSQSRTARYIYYTIDKVTARLQVTALKGIIGWSNKEFSTNLKIGTK